MALVTGAGRRVGRALAVALGRERMRVAVHYHISADGAKETVAEIERAGGHATLFQADLSAPHPPAELVQQVASQLGSLAVVVNSAAVMERTPVGTVSPETWDSIFALNLRAPFLISQAAAPLMRAEGGAIVNIADLVLLPANWEEESGDRLVSTTPLQRLGDPEDVVQAMLYLLRADFVTGETLIVDGGRHIRK